MTTTSFLLEIGAYGFSLWLGLFLLARDWRNPVLRWTGVGLIFYGLSLALDIVAQRAAAGLSTGLSLGHWALLFTPGLFWLGASLALRPEETPHRRPLLTAWSYGLLPVLLVFFYLAFNTNWLVELSPAGVAPGRAYGIFAAVEALLLLAAVAALLSAVGQRPAGSLRLALVATLFFGLGLGLVLFPLTWIPRPWAILAIGFDLMLLGVAVAVLDAFDQGEALLPDFLRSFGYSLLAVVVFGGQIGLVLALDNAAATPLLALLLTTMATAITVQTFSNPLQGWLDRATLPGLPAARAERDTLRGAADAAVRVRATIDWSTIEEEEFARLTRRALGHLGNMPRLAASPLTHLPAVSERLGNTHPTTLARARALKALLAESIDRLKPAGPQNVGFSDEWRFYNALYFPYIRGLKPYSRRYASDNLDEPARKALAWFRDQVPERTLYNWQNAAAELVARELRDQSRLTGRS